MRSTQTTLTVLAIALGAGAGAGCYKYVPATLETVAPEEKIKITITSEAQLDLRDRVGLNSGQLDGEVVEVNGDRFLMAVRSTSAFPEFGSGELYQRLEFSRRDVVRVDRRQVDPLRIGVLAALGAGVVAFAIAEGFQGGRGEAPGTPPGPVERRGRPWILSIPLFLP